MSGSSKTKRKSELTKYDVVLTTFGVCYHWWRAWLLLLILSGRLALELPDYKNEMKTKAKAKKMGDNFIVSDDDDDIRDPVYRNKKQKQQG